MTIKAKRPINPDTRIPITQPIYIFFIPHISSTVQSNQHDLKLYNPSHKPATLFPEKQTEIPPNCYIGFTLFFLALTTIHFSKSLASYGILRTPSLQNPYSSAALYRSSIKSSSQSVVVWTMNRLVSSSTPTHTGT